MMDIDEVTKHLTDIIQNSNGKYKHNETVVILEEVLILLHLNSTLYDSKNNVVVYRDALLKLVVSLNKLVCLVSSKLQYHCNRGISYKIIATRIVNGLKGLKNNPTFITSSCGVELKLDKSIPTLNGLIILLTSNLLTIVNSPLLTNNKLKSEFSATDTLTHVTEAYYNILVIWDNYLTTSDDTFKCFYNSYIK